MEKSVIRHIRCGLHSRIPWCCILWFITYWNVILLVKKLNLWYIRITSKPMEGNPYGWEYIPCPLCLIMKRNMGRTLRCKCGEKYE